MRRWCRRLVLTLAVVIGRIADGRAQTFGIWPGVAPGSERWTHREVTVDDTPLGAVVINVVTPTLTAYLPDTASATRTAVIVAPGGAFVALALELEGTSVARWLQQHGIAAFVLKYRTVEKRESGIPRMDMDTAGRYGIADAVQALRIVRERAPVWGIDPDRVGMLGFSAGAMVVSGALLQADSAARPSFAALIYGAPFGVIPPMPSRLPPVFMAWAEDDSTAAPAVRRLHDSLLAAGHRPAVHIYRAGGHGFGLRRQGTPSDQWIEDFRAWLQAQQLLNHRAK